MSRKIRAFLLALAFAVASPAFAEVSFSPDAKRVNLYRTLKFDVYKASGTEEEQVAAEEKIASSRPAAFFIEGLNSVDTRLTVLMIGMMRCPDCRAVYPYTEAMAANPFISVRYLARDKTPGAREFMIARTGRSNTPSIFIVRPNGEVLDGTYVETPTSVTALLAAAKSAEDRRRIWDDFHKGIYDEYIQRDLLALISNRSRGAATNIGLDERIEMAFTHTLQTQKKDGSFEYALDYRTGGFSLFNHIVRQASAAYGLGEYLRVTGDERARKPLEKTLAFLLRDSTPFNGGLLVSSSPPHPKSPSGATALALIGALRYKASGGELSDGQIEKWLKGLSGLYIEGAGFRTVPATDEESPYYNGETWLALAEYLEAFPHDREIARLVEKVDAYMMERYAREFDGAFFHWGMMALSARYRQTRCKKFLDFGLAQYAKYLDAEENPTTFTEGVTQFYSVLPDRAAKDEVRKKLFFIAKNLFKVQQISSKLPDGSSVSPRAERYIGGFLLEPSGTRTRIDMTQHGLMGLLRLRAYGITLAK
ncbi:MAG: thioredoxin family protein [Synergistaceae bacterium]|jgi:hypothetical protein|nr:thioredoxin family protein [Synergistaceae bacterium]